MVVKQRKFFFEIDLFHKHLWLVHKNRVEQLSQTKSAFCELIAHHELC